MDDFVQLKPDERKLFFEGTATPRNMQAQIVEKDFWVCWTLRELFRLPAIGEHLIFKGGTSLSKVFKVIKRFSEDIDVLIDRSFLGFGGSNEPEAGTSNKEKQRRIDALKVACQQKIAQALLPALEGAIRAKVRQGERWVLRSDADDPDQQTLLFDYPTSFPPDATGYLRRMVKIEMGARADHWPSETKTITPYVAEQFPKGFKEGNRRASMISSLSCASGSPSSTSNDLWHSGRAATAARLFFRRAFRWTIPGSCRSSPSICRAAGRR